MTINSHTARRTAPLLLILSMILGIVSCAHKNGKEELGRLPHEDKDFCKSSNTTLNDLSNDTLNDVYLGIDINSKYPQVLSLLDSLAQDGLVKSVEKVNRPYLGYYTRLILNIGSINIDKSITFKSILSLLKRGEYETIETSCEIFFFDNKLYAIEIPYRG